MRHSFIEFYSIISYGTFLFMHLSYGVGLEVHVPVLAHSTVMHPLSVPGKPHVAALRPSLGCGHLQAAINWGRSTNVDSW